jgi:hypothetical protein
MPLAAGILSRELAVALMAANTRYISDFVRNSFILEFASEALQMNFTRF